MKISVITPTWHRHNLLLNRCIPSVYNQTLPVFEHIVVSDGPDNELKDKLIDSNVIYAELPEHPTEEINFGGYARNFALELVSGDLVAYLDDDNMYRPNHIEILASSFTEVTVDFAYSQMYRHGLNDVIGQDPPVLGGIDTSLIMHKLETASRFGFWPVPEPKFLDWVLVETWLKAGATYKFIPEITVDYYWRGSS